jgi:AbrB family looped-hinge helix DNA binding protein
LTLKLKVGKKGYIILPKTIRDIMGINEGDEVIVEVKDAIILKPTKKIDKDKLKNALKRHVNKIKKIPTIIEPKPGELSKVYLEEEFED